MVVIPHILHSNKSLITKPNIMKMVQSRENRLFATNLNITTTVSSSLELSTSEETSYDSHTNVLHPTPLKDGFVSHRQSTPILAQEKLAVAVNKMKEIMRKNGNKVGNQVEELIIIDTIQRLGIEHHFENEINDVLERHYAEYCLTGECGGDLYEVSLRFRLLRQHGYNVVATDTFARFKDQDGKFKSTLGNNIKGLISLFEASQLSIQGDNILDEASEYCRNILELYSKTSQHAEAEHIRNTLNYPCRRSLPRLMARNFLFELETYLDVFHNVKVANGWIKMIQDVARKDFYMAQVTHHCEISEVSRWWKQINLGAELKRARDQPVKWYMWSVAALPNPIMGEERIQLTKLISLIYVMDDIFDVYGTLEELTVFTKEINRWDYAEESLPHYLRIYFKALHDTVDEMSNRISFNYGWNPKEPIRQADENQDGNDWSFIECYMKEHEGSSTQGARDTINILISNAWKCLNEKCLSQRRHFSPHLIEACLNLAKMVPLMYSYDDEHRLLDLERHMQEFLYENVN